MKKKVQEYLTYLTPDFIFIDFDKTELLRIKKNKIVYNGMFLGEKENGEKIYSPVSGRVVGVKEMEYSFGKKNSLVIENDFVDKREKLNPYKELFKAKKTDITEILEKYNLNRKFNSKTTLVINSLYNKRTDLSDMVINYENYEEILECIDVIMMSYNIKVCYIVVPRSDLYSEFSFNKYINAFPNMCLVHTNLKYVEKSSVFYTIEEILAINTAIHKDYYLDTTFLTIFEEKEKKSTIVKTKVNTSLYELFRTLKISKKDKKIYVDNKKVETNDFVITKNNRTVTIK